MTSFFLLEWNWTLFLVGCLGCFGRIFLEYKSKNNLPGIKLIIFDLFSIIIAGCFTIIIQAVTPWQALIFGATWDFMFRSAINPTRGEKNHE